MSAQQIYLKKAWSDELEKRLKSFASDMVDAGIALQEAKSALGEEMVKNALWRYKGDRKRSAEQLCVDYKTIKYWEQGGK